MSFLSLALPAVEVAINTIASVARPLLGLGILATVLVVFRPLITGVWRAVLVLLQPKLSREERAAQRHLRTMRAIQRASNVDSSSPSMSAELRALASRA